MLIRVSAGARSLFVTLNLKTAKALGVVVPHRSCCVLTKVIE
jgi:hypothetical protein